MLTIATLLTTGCMSTSPPGIDPGLADSADSLNADSYENMFVEIHGRVLRKIDESKGADPAIIEARTIVEIAEEFYLQGNTLLAIKLMFNHSFIKFPISFSFMF